MPHERLLTEVNNSSGPLDDATREQAHTLLLQNAVYVRNAQRQRRLAEAAVLENFGRVLTTLDNEPPTPHSTWRLRLEMNTSGLTARYQVLADKTTINPKELHNDNSIRTTSGRLLCILSQRRQRNFTR